eukprot:scaffold2642_cov183-Ochromonas_danica.AAC.13
MSTNIGSENCSLTSNIIIRFKNRNDFKLLEGKKVKEDLLKEDEVLELDIYKKQQQENVLSNKKEKDDDDELSYEKEETS